MTVAIMAATTLLLLDSGGCLAAWDDGFFCSMAGAVPGAGFSGTAGPGLTGSFDGCLTGSDG